MGTAISRKDSAEVSYSQVVSLLTFCLSTQPLGQPDGSSAPCQLRTRHSSQNNDPNVTAPNVTEPVDSPNTIPDSPLESLPTNVSGGGIGPDYAGIEGRTNFLVEYFGEGASGTSSQSCSSKLHNDLASLSECDAALDCKCQDSRNNTYACIRSYGQEDSLFCKFDDSENFLEMYSLAQDKYQLTNIAGLLQNETKEHYL